MIVSFSRLQKKWAIWTDDMRQIGTYAELEFKNLDATFIIKTNEQLRERQGWIRCEGMLKLDGEKAVIHGEQAAHHNQDHVRAACEGHGD